MTSTSPVALTTCAFVPIRFDFHNPYSRSVYEGLPEEKRLIIRSSLFFLLSPGVLETMIIKIRLSGVCGIINGLGEGKPVFQD